MKMPRLAFGEADAALEIKLQRAAERSKQMQMRKKRSELVRRLRTLSPGEDAQSARASASGACPAASKNVTRGGEKIHGVSKAVLRARLAKGRLRGSALPVRSSHKFGQIRKKAGFSIKRTFRRDVFHGFSGVEDLKAPGSPADSEFGFYAASPVPDSPACEDSAASAAPPTSESNVNGRDVEEPVGDMQCCSEGLPEITSAVKASAANPGTFVDDAALPLEARYEALANVMDAHVDEPIVQKECSEAICKMCQENAVHAARLCSLGAVGLVSRAMDRYPEDVALQVPALLAFRCLNSIRGGQDPSGIHPDSCGITKLLTIIERQLHSAPVLEAAFGALVAIVTSCTECKVAASQSRTAEVMLSAMAAQENSAGVQEAGCQLLKELAARSEDVQDRILAASGIERVLAAMNAHAAAASLQVAGCGVLRNMSARNQERRSQIAALGGVSTVLRALSTHSEDWQVQWAGCWALCCLTMQNSPSQAEAVGNGAIQLVLRSMDLHIGAPKVQEAACWALSPLVGASSLRSAALSELLLAVSRAMQAHHTDEVLKAGRQLRQKLITVGAARNHHAAGLIKACRSACPFPLATPSTVKRHCSRGLFSIRE